MRLKKQGKILILCLIGAIGLLARVMIFMFNSSPIQFISERDIEIQSKVDYSTFIKKIKDGNLKDVKIDSSQVNINKVGDYTVVYHFKDDDISLKVHVVDTVAPKFEVVEQEVAVNQKVNPQYLVSNIEDLSKTTVEFDKKYSFNKTGEITVNVIVKDEGNNETKKSVKLKVVKDNEPPVMVASDLRFVVGEKVKLEDFIKVSDNLDKNPLIQVDSGQLDMNKAGTYPITYTVSDASTHSVKKTIQVEVVNKTTSDEKVVYLTFDDGPSRNTQAVLDILAKYNAKGTFFVTGMNEPYRKLMKAANDQGHTIGLHTYSHSYSQVYSSTNAYFEDLTNIGNVVKDYIGFTPRFIRFPGGGSNAISKKYTPGIMSELSQLVEKKGYLYYDWNAENGDGYAHMSESEMLRRATLSKANHVMILMHDANGKQSTINVLPKVIEHYQRLGYAFKGIDSSTSTFHQKINN